MDKFNVIKISDIIHEISAIKIIEFSDKSAVLKDNLLFLLKVSRPGLWFATVWMYLLPTSQMDIWYSIPFYLGLFYVTFPLNFMVYGWNDIYDQQTDAHNPRKDSFWFGAKGSPDQLKNLFKYIIAVQFIIYPMFIIIVGPKMLLLLFGFMIINALYNWPIYGLKSSPPFELICQFGYILVVPFSMLLNETESLSIFTYIYLFLFAVQSHLMGEVMDIESDKKAGRKTTATVIGIIKTKILIISIVLSEIALLMLVFNDLPFTLMLIGALCWLLLDLLFIFKNKNYTIGQMKFFGLSSNLLAILSMSYMWYSGCLF